MRFITLSSSSIGNGYMLQASSGQVLIIEAGVRLKQVKKALDFDLTGIIGLICSHGHNDHARYVREYLQAGIRCYMNEETRKAQANGSNFSNIRIVKEEEQRAIGEFIIKPFLLEHDVENFGYLIHHHESGFICFITDTQYCSPRFPGLNQILIEANYSDKIINEKLLDGTAKLYVRDRVLTYHMEIETTKAFLQANDLSKVANIVLLHLSMGNSNQDQFRKEVTALTGKPVFIAEPGLNILLDKQPF